MRNVACSSISFYAQNFQQVCATGSERTCMTLGNDLHLSTKSLALNKMVECLAPDRKMHAKFLQI